MSKDIQELEQTLASDPHDQDTFNELEERLSQARRWQDLLKLYEGQDVLQREMPRFWERAVVRLEGICEQLEELPEKAEVYIQLGHLWEQRLERQDQAMVHYQRAFKVWPYKTEALDFARGIYAAQKNWKLVLRLFDLQLQVEKEPANQARIFREKGRVAIEEMGLEEEGLALVRKALEIYPADTEAQALLAAHTEAQPGWEETVARLRDDLTRAGRGAGAAALHVTIARTLMEHDGDAGEIETELKAAMGLAPHQPEAREALMGFYRDGERWQELADLLEATAGESTTRKEEARAALIELSKIQRERFEDEAAAVATFEKLLAMDPSHPEALQFAQDFYEREQKWEALVELYESALRLKRSSPDEIDLRLALGEVLWKKVGDREAAERQYRRVRLADPKRPEMLRFYQAFFADEQDWKKYYSTLATLRQVIEDPAEDLELSIEMARVAREEMESPEKAIDVWKSVLKVDPTHERARAELHDLYIEAKKWNALLEHYKEEIGLIEGDDSDASRARQVELHLKMVEIYRDRLRLDVMVINTYNAILQLDPINSDAIDALAERYESSKRWNDLINILQRKADVLSNSDPDAMLPLLHQIADLWQKRLGNISQAIPALEQVLEISPTDKVAIEELKGIYAKRHKWPELLVVLEKEAGLLEGKELAAHLAEMARTARQRLGDRDGARDYHERVCQALEQDNGEVADAALYRGALGELDKIYIEESNDAALKTVYERRLKVTQSKGQRIEILEQLAALCFGSLGQADQAVTLWEEILELQPRHGAALERLTAHYVEQRRWDALETLFGARGDWERLFEILDTGATMVDEEAGRIDLYGRMARIASDHLGDAQRVMLSLESILELSPADVEVARRLLPYYRDAHEHAKEIQANLILLENDGGDAFALTREIGRLYEEKLEDLPSAFDWADRAFRMHPEDTALRAHIEGLGRSADRLAELVATYRQVAEGVDDDGVRLALYRTVARTANMDLEWFDDAVDYYERLLRANGEDTEAIDALLILYRQLERWDALLEVMGQKIAQLEAVGDGDGVVTLRFQVAELLQGPLDRRVDAIGVYGEILDAQPDNLDAVRGVKVLHEVGEDWPGVAEAMERELGLLEKAGVGEEAAQLRLSLGHLYEEQLAEPDRAVDWYASLLNGPDGARAPAISALESLLGNDGEVEDARRVRIATLLEPVHRKDENFRALADMLEIRLGAMDDAEARVATLWELASLYEGKVEDVAGAYSALERLLGQTPHDARVWNEIERLAGQLDRWEHLAGLYDERTPGRGEIDADGWCFDLLRRQARIHEQELGQDAAAREAYEVLLERDDADRETIERLEQVYERLEAWYDLVELLERKATLVEEVEARREVRFAVASLQEERLEAPGRAIDTFRLVLVDEPGQVQALDELERLLAGQERWHELVDLLHQRVELAEGDEARHAVKYQLGQVLQTQVDDLSGAIGVYREIVEANPEHLALSTLESIGEELHAAEGDLMLRRMVDDILEPIYQSGQHWAKLVGVLEQKLGYADDDHDRAELHIRLARLQRDRLESPRVAFDHLRAAVALRFEDEALRAEFEALADGIEAHAEVVGLYEGHMDALVDPALRRVVLQRVATLQEEHLADVEAAIDAYRRMLEHDAADEGALASLERLHEQEQQWAELVHVCQRQADLATDEEARIERLTRVGGLYRERLYEPTEAIETYRRILALSPGHDVALTALEELYTEGESWRELVQVLRDRIEVSPEVDDRRALYFRIAALYEGQLAEPFEAIETYRQVLELVVDDPAALDALEILYREHERWPELAGVIERKLALADDDEARNALQFALGQIQQHQFYEVDRAIETYAAVLARKADAQDPRQALMALLDDPEHRFAASKVLEPHYRAEEAHDALVDLLELQLEDVHEPEARLVLLDDIARIQEHERAEAELAFHAVRRAYLIDPSARPRIEAMERLADETGLYESLVREAYEQALGQIADGDELLRVYLKVARVYRDQLGDVEAAEASFRNALLQEPDCLEALDALEVMLSGQERWYDLLEILQEKHRCLMERDQAAGMAELFKIATLYDETLSNPTDAIEALRRVLELDASSTEAITGLKALYRRETRWEELTSLLGHEIELVAQDVDQTVALRTELAEVWYTQLGEERQAVEVYRRILQDRPDHAQTVTSLEGFFAQEVERQEVARILDPIYRRRNAWGPLVEVLEVHLADEVETDARQSLLTQIARLCEERLDRPQDALEAYQRLLDENPTVPAVWDQIERLAASLGAWDSVAAAYGDALASNLKVTDEVRQALLLRHAQVLDERLDRIEDARGVYREVLFIDDTNAVAHDALDRILTRLEEWHDLVDLYRRAAELSDDDARRLSLSYRIATLHEEVLGDPDNAIEAYRLILEVEPDERDAVRGLERLYQQEQRWRDLADLYRREALGADDAHSRIVLQHQLASLLCVELGEVAEAVGIFRQIIGERPDYEPSRRTLEELLRTVGDSDLQLQIALMLQPLYNEETEWEKLVTSYEIQLEIIQDPASRVQILKEVARLRRDRQGDMGAAFEAYARAFAEDARDPALQENLEALADALDNWGALIEIYLGAMGRTADMTRLVELLHRAAELYITKLDDRESAITVYQQILDIDDRNRPSIARLEELFALEQRWQDLVDVLERRVELEDNVLERKETCYRIAELWEKSLGDDLRAIETYRQIMDMDDEDLAAIEALERLYRRTEAWENLIAIFQVKVDVVEEDDEKIAVYRLMADVFEHQMMEVDRAVATLLTIRDLDEQDMDTLHALERLYQQEQRWDDLLDILDVERKLLEPGDGLDTLEFRMGQLLEEELDQPERAIEVYRAVLGRSPDHVPSIEALESLINEPRVRLEAARVLEPLYQRKGEWRKLVDALELTLQENPEPDARRQTLQRIAAIHESELDSRQMAFITYGRAFREDPTHDMPREQLERLAMEMASYDELVAVYEEKLVDIYDFEMVTRLNSRLGEIYRDKLGDPETAIDRYRRVIEVEEYHRGALDALDRLYGEHNRQQEQLEILERKIQIADDQERVELKFRLAYLYDVSFEEFDRAIALYREILDDQPEHGEALAALERLARNQTYRLDIADILEPHYIEHGKWASLVTLVGLRLEMTDYPTDRCAMFRRIAELTEVKLQDPRGAFDQYLQALDADPEDGSVGRHLERLAAACDTWVELVMAYDEVTPRIMDDVERRALLLKLGHWYLEKLDDPGQAEARLREILASEPGHPEALDALEAICASQGRAADLYEIYARKADLLFDADARKAMFLKMAKLAEDELHDPERAIEAFDQLRQSDDTDAEALVNLQRLYGVQGHWTELVEVLDRRADLSDDIEQRVALRLQIGQVSRDQLGEPDAAIDAFRAVLDLDAGNVEALGALEALFEETERWTELQEALGQMLTFASDEDRRVALHLKLATLCEERFEDLDGALEHYRQVSLSQPDHVGAISHLERLYAKAERWYDLQEIFLQRLELTEDPAERIRLYVAISDVSAEHLGDVATAKEYLQKVLDAEPDNMGALTVLGKLYLQDAEWEQAMAVLDRQLALSSDPATLATLQVRRGAVLEDHMGQPEEARAAFLQAVSLDPSNATARQAARRVLSAAEQWGQLLDLYRVEGRFVTEPAARVKLFLEMAEVARDRLDDQASAIEALEVAYGASDDDLEVSEQLLQAYVDTEQWSKAVPLLDSIIETLEAKRRFKQLFTFHHLRGQIAEKKGNLVAAMESYQAAYEIDATYVPNLLSLGKLYIMQEDWDSALKIFQTLLLHQMKIKRDDDKRDVYYNLGRIRMMRGDERRARDMFNRALSIDKGHAPSLAALEELS